MADLLALTAKETGLVQQFIELLRQEQSALQLGEPARLPALVEAKTSLVDALNKISSERNQFLSQQGLVGDKAGMQAWLDSNPKEKALRKSWNHLLELAAEARELHRQNGQLIHLHLQSTHEALGVLTQKMQKSLLYGPDGQSSSGAVSRINDKA